MHRFCVLHSAQCPRPSIMKTLSMLGSDSLPDTRSTFESKCAPKKQTSESFKNLNNILGNHSVLDGEIPRPVVRQRLTPRQRKVERALSLRHQIRRNCEIWDTDLIGQCQSVKKVIAWK